MNSIFQRAAVTACCVVIGALAVAKVPTVPSMVDLHRPFGDNDKTLFSSPGKIHYPETWFHYISGNVSKEGITADLEAIAAAGIYGVQLFHGQFGGMWPATGDPITCLSPSWNDAVRYTAEECERLGLRFTMQNCPGWATAGGPWITTENSMRNIVNSRTDVVTSDGIIDITLPRPRWCDDQWRDYRDITVLAFPAPEGDDGVPLMPAHVTGSGEVDWEELMTGRRNDVSLPSAGDGCHWFEVSFDTVAVIRTVEFPSIDRMNHRRCYEPALRLTVDALMPDGSTCRIADTDMPQSNWQDSSPISLACNETSGACKYRIEIRNKYDITLRRINFLTAARKNSWESEAGHTLRSIERKGERALQSSEAYVVSDKICDITEFTDSAGHLKWTAPEGGRWIVLRIGHVNTGAQNTPAPPEGTGWECDKLSEKGAEAHFAGYIGRIADTALQGGMLGGMLLDSWECGTQTWTVNMESEFEAIAGYKLRKMLPAVFGYVIDNPETTTRFLLDWRGVIGRLFAEKFYKRMSELGHEKGLAIAYETAGGDVFPADIMEYFKYADIPMCEYWQPFTEGFVGSLNFKPVKPTASAARIYGKPRVAAEAFTSFELTWDEHWENLKEIADFNAVEGVTHNVFHTYTHNPQVGFLPPGTSFGSDIGTPFLRGQTWWKHFGAFTSYLARCCYMLERGIPVSEVLWYMGDEINHKPDQEFELPEGFKYDYCNPDVLLNRLTVVDGRITTPEGISYGILWVPDNKRMRPETLEKIRALLEAGAVVVADAPEGLATLIGGSESQQRFDRAVSAIWGNARKGTVTSIGKGKLLTGVDITQALPMLGKQADVKGGDVRWLHRRTEGADWYFVCAPKGRGFKGKLDFHATGRAELWDPLTGQVTPLKSVTNGQYSSVDIDLPRAGSCFVVFDNNSKPVKLKDRPLPQREVNISEGWAVTFPEGWGAPRELPLDSLTAWKDMDMSPEGRAFSGTAVYTVEFDMARVKKGQPVILDLGNVDMIAVVKVNGKDVGTLWCHPYRTDISHVVKSGRNTLTVEVTGTWYNRLVYDASLPETERKTWTISGPPADAPLRESGLMGPVTVRY